MNGENHISTQESDRDRFKRQAHTHFQSRHREGEIKTSSTSDNESGLNLKKVILGGIVTGVTFFGVSALLGRFFKDDK